LSDPRLEPLLDAACEEEGLPRYYRACVKPLLRDPNGRWPRCCGGGCEPCASTLINVAVRVLNALGTPRTEPIPS
jgi:hypothetical protein